MRLTEAQVQAFRREGVLVAEGVLAAEDLAPVIAEYETWIDRRAQQLKAQGKIADLCEEEPFERRFASLYDQCREIECGLDLMRARLPAAFALMRNENLLDAVECLIGPEITCGPIQHLRAKPPAALSGEGPGFYNVPWHQDAGVTWEEADASEIVTCWLPLVDATPQNGCLEVMPGVFRRGFLEHQAEGGTTIRPDLLPNVLPRPLPVKKGGVIFMHRHTPHRSTPNFSDSVRWSIDLRYQPIGRRRDARSTPTSSPAAAPIPSRSSPITPSGIVAGKRRSPAPSLGLTA